jgi:CubicO group peptidase (beta-lactamase class C family)
VENAASIRRLKGHLHPDFARVALALERQLSRTPGGAAVCVYHRGELVADLWGGSRDSQGHAWEAGTMSFSFSTTKGVAATALHILADRGLLDYDDPVAKHWPEFAQNGKESITVRQVLCHEAGLYRMRDYVDHVERVTDWSYMTDVLARAKPAHEPGTRNGYHAWTFGWLVGEIVQRVARKPFSEVIESEIARPLALDGFYVGAPDSEHARVAEVLRPERQISTESLRATARRVHRVLSALRVPLDLEAFANAHIPRGVEELHYTTPDMLRIPMPAANGVFTARALARFYAALANGGELNGVRLLSAETLARATEIQNRRPDRVLLGIPMHWRLGYHRIFAGGGGGARSGFGHWGADGSCGWADPARNLAFALVLNHGMLTPLIHRRTVRLSRAALRSAERR